MEKLLKSTICAPATAQGGAIGIIRVSGPDAISITDKLFRGRQPLCQAKSHTIHYGQIVSTPLPEGFCPPGNGGTEGSEESIAGAGREAVDEVLVSVFSQGHSYTGEPSCEISCHGSSYIIQKIVELLLDNGCEMAQPGEFTKRAYLNGRMDLSQAEAVADIIASRNEAQLKVAMNQMRGGISRKLRELREKLLTLTSLLELELDFSDHEELEFADRSELSALSSQLSTEIKRLTDSFHTGNAIKNGIPVAILGAPNVGKSTLLNQLLEDDKAIVSDTPGTTRDTIEDTIYISSPHGEDGRGLLFRFIDTAGIRKTADKIENLGIERSFQAAEKAQIIILMRDPDNDYPEFKGSSGSKVPEFQKIIKVFNKTDEFQALTGKGLDWLKEQLIAAVPKNTDELLITNIRHYNCLKLALSDIERVRVSMQQGLSGDLIAEDLRQCLDHLAEIMGGAITTDEVLGNIFSHFCIGK